MDAGPYNPTGPKTPTASLPHLVKVRAIAFLVLRDGGKIGNTKVSGIQAAGGGINKNVAFGALLRMPVSAGVRWRVCGSGRVGECRFRWPPRPDLPPSS